MDIIEQSKRLLGLDAEKANGNAYLGLIALSGLIGWAATVYVMHFIHPLPSGTVSGHELHDWHHAVESYRWPLMAVWGGVWIGRVVWGYLRVERGAVGNLPNLLWLSLVSIAFGVNVYGILTSQVWLVWMPWLAVFAVGYLGTASMIERSRIYWIAGAVSALLLVYTIYVKLTMSIPLGGTLAGAGGHEASSHAVDHIVLPLPYFYAVMGLLHVAPLAIDAAMGGRQLTDDGVPQVKADRMDDDEAGSVQVVSGD